MTDQHRRRIEQALGETIRIIDRSQPMTELERAAKALLAKLDNMTTEEFSRGGERPERRALHAELVRLGFMEFDADGNRVVKAA